MGVQYVEGDRMPRTWVGLEMLICSIALVILCLGAAPKQSEVPPQAFFADYFSGAVFLHGTIPPSGIELIACIRNCQTFQSEGMKLDEDGGFVLLEVNPADRFLRGDEIRFYLVNAHGKIQATETAVFEGKYAIVEIKLNFNSDLPSPMPPPSLPQVGDSVITLLPRLALGVGTVLLVAGIAILVVSRRRVARR